MYPCPAYGSIDRTILKKTKFVKKNAVLVSKILRMTTTMTRRRRREEEEESPPKRN